MSLFTRAHRAAGSLAPAKRAEDEEQRIHPSFVLGIFCPARHRAQLAHHGRRADRDQITFSPLQSLDEEDSRVETHKVVVIARVQHVLNATLSKQRIHVVARPNLELLVLMELILHRTKPSWRKQDRLNLSIGGEVEQRAGGVEAEQLRLPLAQTRGLLVL